jgi:hypothetical protein
MKKPPKCEASSQDNYSSRVRKYRVPVEGFATNIALVWFLIGVDDLVTAECGRLPESFATNFAHKRPGACTIEEIQFADFNFKFFIGYLSSRHCIIKNECVLCKLQPAILKAIFTDKLAKSQSV